MSLVLVKRSDRAVLVGSLPLPDGGHGDVEQDLPEDLLLEGILIRDFPLGVTPVNTEAAMKVLEDVL